ncbi:dcd1B, partial [Symbiodinium sp. KB8]
MAGTNISVLHLRGSAFEMGQQYGSLMREEIIQLFPDMYTYIDEQIDNFLEKLPESIRKAIEEYGVPAALQITVDATSPYTPQHWFDLINGMSNTSGVNVTDIHRLILFPELVKAACTNIGAWGAATASGTDLLALRALDFGLDKPLNKFPVLLNFHPTDGGASHSVLSWAGFLGTITGMSSSGMAVTEKVWDAYTELQNI